MTTRLWFPLVREIKKDNSQGDKFYSGYFSCLEHVAKFLDIDKKASSTGIIAVEREYSTQRTSTRVDGSKLTAGSENNSSSKRKVQVILRRKVGKKRVVIKTRKEIADSKQDANKKRKPKHEISFAFPGWATALVVSEALAEIIPENKISNDSEKKETIPPVFKFASGGSYGIMSKAEAGQRKGVTTSENQIEQKLNQEGGEVIEGQGD